jgi:hypothetical protein
VFFYDYSVLSGLCWVPVPTKLSEELKQINIKDILSTKLKVYRYIDIDGQVCLVRLKTDNFRLFFANKHGQTTNFHLYDEQTVNGLRQITWASVFRLKQQHIHTYLYTCCHFNVFIFTENGNFRLFAANGKRKRKTSLCFLSTENGSLFSLVGKR